MWNGGNKCFIFATNLLNFCMYINKSLICKFISKFQKYKNEYVGKIFFTFSQKYFEQLCAGPFSNPLHVKWIECEVTVGILNGMEVCNTTSSFT